jgi:hypothetical protein
MEFKDNLTQWLELRKNALKDLVDRDYAGNMVGLNEAYREIKHLKEKIERGEFDGKRFR